MKVTNTRVRVGRITFLTDNHFCLMYLDTGLSG